MGGFQGGEVTIVGSLTIGLSPVVENHSFLVKLACGSVLLKAFSQVSWHLNSATLLGKESSVEHANLTGTSRNKIEITVSRHHLGKR